MQDDDVAGGTATPGTHDRTIAIAIPAAERPAFLPEATRARLESLGAVRIAEPASLHDSSAFAAFAGDADVLVTAWGFPRLGAAQLTLAPNLGLVMHAASSVRAIVSDALWASGIPVAQAGAAMSPAVAELSLTLTLNLLRRTPQMEHRLRAGDDWERARAVPRPREIAGCRIGVIGASRTGRAYIAMCEALGAEIRVVDPYLAETDPLHAKAVTLDELLATSEIVAIHAPETAETIGMLGAAELARIADGAGVVNTARAAIVDDDALYAEVASGRLAAALDVHATEPLPADDRWRFVDNAMITAHLGGATAQSRARAGNIVADEIARHFAGEPLQHTVTRELVERMG